MGSLQRSARRGKGACRIRGRRRGINLSDLASHMSKGAASGALPPIKKNHQPKTKPPMFPGSAANKQSDNAYVYSTLRWAEKKIPRYASIPSVSKKILQLSLPEESNNFKFDQIYVKKY